MVNKVTTAQLDKRLAAVEKKQELVVESLDFLRKRVEAVGIAFSKQDTAAAYEGIDFLVAYLDDVVKKCKDCG